MAIVVTDAQINRNRLMNTNIRKALPDHASEIDHRKIPLNRVGIQGLRYPIRVLDKTGETQTTVAEIGVYVALPAEQRGTHMSRLVEMIHLHRGEMTIRRLPHLLREIRNRLEAPGVELALSFPYFIDKPAPISGVRSLMDYEVGFRARLHEGQFQFELAVKIPVKSLCPCSKGISERGAHNQRSTVAVRLQSEGFIWIEDVVEVIESVASAPLFALLKREDEKFITELAYDNPKFAEDLARDSLQALRGLEGVTNVSVVVENQESIHNHQAYAAVDWRAQDERPAERTSATALKVPMERGVHEFGSWLKAIRRDRKLSQSELAKSLDLTPSFISRIESNGRAPSLDMLVRLSEILGISQDELFLRAGHLPPKFRTWAMVDPDSILSRLEQ